ncbi:MAG TPA: glycosyltransferase [Solirubrobacteraceae bacterium]|nr:glycosyltransferase [Solirubrobacteraceae bacterium]
MAERIGCSILVPVFNEERYIAASVAAMQRQRFDGELEFIFVDGRSTDRTREILEALAREDPRIRVFDNPRRTVSSGLNVALRHARGEWVARMDAHTVYPDDYVARGVLRLKAGGTRWVSGPQRPRGDNLVSKTVALALASPLGRGGSRKWGSDARVTGGEFELDSGVFAGVWSRATLLEYGGWDERWPRNSDSEMAARFMERGERLICLPEMSAEYVPRGTIAGLWRQYRGYGRYRERTALAHPASMRRSHLLAPGLVMALGVSLVAPRPLRLAARAGVSIWALALFGSGAQALVGRRPPAECALLPIVLATMHLGHGVGTLEGVVRYGVPTDALKRAAGLRATSRPAGDAALAYAPSLTGEE